MGSYDGWPQEQDAGSVMTLVDITEPTHGVIVQIREDGKVIWIHVDGLTVLRVCRIPKLEVKDERKKKSGSRH